MQQIAKFSRIIFPLNFVSNIFVNSIGYTKLAQIGNIAFYCLTLKYKKDGAL